MKLKITPHGEIKLPSEASVKIYAIEGIGASLDLAKTLNCGQSFRWLKVMQNSYLGETQGHITILKQKDGVLYTTASPEEFALIWHEYLGLNIDYEAKINIDNLDNFASESYEVGRGIKILHQDPWETLVSFIISQRNNIPKITTSIEKLCRSYERNRRQQAGLVWYVFPTAQDIIEHGDKPLNMAGLGYRVNYVLQAAHAVESGHINLEKLNKPETSYECAMQELLELYGVGPKVANCVCLFGLGKLDAFPIDVWMERIIKEHYPNGLNPKKYGELAGVIQQYMFYNIRGKNL